MVATILKSPQAVQAALAIIETFSKIRNLSRNIKTLSNIKDKREQQALMRKSGEIIAELLDDDIETTDTETSIELNFAVLKFKHTIKKQKKEKFARSPAHVQNSGFCGGLCRIFRMPPIWPCRSLLRECTCHPSLKIDHREFLNGI